MSDEPPQVYAVRVVPSVAAWIEEEHAAQASRNGGAAADVWERGLLAALASLATDPLRCAIAAEDALFPHGALRLLLYPVRRGAAVWRILFTVQKGDEDAPAVYVRLTRQAAQAPLDAWPAEGN